MAQTPDNITSFDKEIGNYPIKIVALGGLDEMGKNCYIIEVNNDAFIIEAGLKYPATSLPGVDIIIPDFDYVKSIAKRVKAIIITHGHDDQYGALPYLLSVVKAPIYASMTTIGIIKANYAKKFKKIESFDFVPVDPNGTIVIAGHVFDLFQTTHSVAESFGFALKTKFGNIVYTSDFISDYSSLKGFQFNLAKVVRLSEENTFLLMAESEGADKPGIASPNHKITNLIKDDIEEPTGKTFVSIYNQNFYNIQEVLNLAIKYKKKVCIANQEQIPFFDMMAKIGSLRIPDGMIVPLDEINIVSPRDLIVLVSGSGEELFELCKDICYNNVSGLKVETNDTWINCAPSVPGTEVIATEASDTIFRTDCHVLTLGRKQVYSMHAQQEDLKLMISLFRPKFYLPVKGEYRLLMANAMLAISLGIGLNHFNTFVFDNGMALAFDEKGALVKKNIIVRNGDIMVDGNSIGEVKENIIEERQMMSEGGVILIGLTISSKKEMVVSAADVQMRGFLYLKDSEPLISQISGIVITNVTKYMQDSEGRLSTADMERKVADKVSKYLIKQTSKNPSVVCKIIDIDNVVEIDPR